jgi:hypothetical protein
MDEKYERAYNDREWDRQLADACSYMECIRREKEIEEEERAAMRAKGETRFSRMQHEFDTVSERLIDLQTFIARNSDGGCSELQNGDGFLLMSQLDAMALYRNILGERIRIFETENGG